MFKISGQVILICLDIVYMHGRQWMPYTPNKHQKDKDSGSITTMTVLVTKLGQVIYGTTASSMKTIKMGLNLGVVHFCVQFF